MQLPRLIATVIITLYALGLLSAHSTGQYRPHIFLDPLYGVNTLVHEAGHLLTMPLSMLSHGAPGGWPVFLNVAAGSLLQWTVPLLFLIYFLTRQGWFSSFIILFWCGHSLLQSADYIRDAKLMLLPLLGGTGSIHDWNFILTDLNLLSYAPLLAQLVTTVAVLIIATSLSLAWYLTWYSPPDETSFSHLRRRVQGRDRQV